MRKILIVFGTRPEAIKMAPLVKHFKKHVGQFDTKVCVTAQHREMLDQVLDFFGLEPDYDLNLMKPNQNLYSLTADLMLGMKAILDDVHPEFVFVHGDTTTSTAVALSGFYHGVKVCHVEAGLRTYNKHAPWPEELNRQLTGRIADFHFAPTERSKQNLLEEKVPEDTILVTGNTVIDALFYAVERVRYNPPRIAALEALFAAEDRVQMSGVSGETTPRSSTIINHQLSTDQDDPQVVLITGHRRENHGQGFENICKAIAELASRFPDVHFIYPVHLNPNVRQPVNRILRNPVSSDQTYEVRSPDGSAFKEANERRGSVTSMQPKTENIEPKTRYPNVHLIEPLDYPSFVWLMDKAKLIITDSGGVQEEAPSLGKPVLVMRDTTERPEAVESGTVVLVGTDPDKIVSESVSLLTDEKHYNEMAHLYNPYGDGHACERIVQYLARLDPRKS